MKDEASAYDPGAGLACGVLLTFVGGYLDAYTYLDYGGIFANTQSGNIILAAIALADRQWHVAAHHLPSVLALVVGTFFARWVQSAFMNRRLDAQQACLAFEALILLATMAISGHAPNYIVTVPISFAAAVQWTAFETVGSWPYMSVATTGNIRRLADALFSLRLAHTGSASFRAQTFACISLGFAIGATAGAFGARELHEHAVAVPALCLMGMFVYLVRRAKP
jgi:uncharacterized membrane protein YoaK (UPF0700 family)